jgi:peptidoglycan/xylan/chitin deacetylase (PgdA/CDA1 family)
MKQIALKVDVDTYNGTRTGVPRLIESLRQHGARASFYFSLGPDQTGREAACESLKRYYNTTSRLYGRILPGPEIGRLCRAIMTDVRDAGFEAGIHAWNRARWEKAGFDAEPALVEEEMRHAIMRHEEIFATPAPGFAAPGWRMSRHALRLTQRLGFLYASDCRGSQPFLPVIDGELIACIQIPTTLPTLDEVLSLDASLVPEQAVDRIFQLSRAIPGDHVFTLRAELEGIRFAGAFESLLERWRESGYELIPLAELHATLKAETLPRCSVEIGEVPGRHGSRLIQGNEFLRP